MRPRAGRLRGPSPARSVCLAPLAGHLLEGGLGLSLLLQHRLGRPNGLEPVLPARQFGGQFITPPVRAIRRIISRIRRIGLRQ